MRQVDWMEHIGFASLKGGARNTVKSTLVDAKIVSRLLNLPLNELSPCYLFAYNHLYVSR